MHTEEILRSLTKPFIMAGIYKDEKSALTDITYTMLKDDNFRIISARPVTKHERKKYEEQ